MNDDDDHEDDGDGGTHAAALTRREAKSSSQASRQRQRPFSHSHYQEALHFLHARLVQAPSCAEMFAQGAQLIGGQLELEAVSRKCQAQQWHVCRKGLQTQTVTNIPPAPDSAAH